MKVTYDPKTGVTYSAWDTMNTDAQPETTKAERILYDMKAQTSQTEIISNFIECVDAGTLRFLESKDNGDYVMNDDFDLNSTVMPYVQEELFFQEVSNLRLVQNGKRLSVDKFVRKFDKDRFSAVAYLLFFIIKVIDANGNKNSDIKAFVDKLKNLNKRPKMY